MKLTFIQPKPELRPYIESFWAFESDSGLPATDTSVAAPNGCSKLIIPYENSLLSRAGGERVKESKEHGLYFVGMRATSTVISSSAKKTGFIGIEFRPHGACRFLDLPMIETTNGLFSFEELFARLGREMREALCNLESVGQKARFIQDRLACLLRENQRYNPVVDYAVETLRASHGLATIKELERETGYTRRYLDLLFREYVGLSPKILAGIFRFQRFYKKWAEGQTYDSLKEDLYDYYYDQSHFTKEFKKFTNYSPQEFTSKISNEFGRRLLLK